jgi:hypothetical protein
MRYQNRNRSVEAIVDRCDNGGDGGLRGVVTPSWHVTVAAWSGPGNEWDVVDERDFNNGGDADAWAREQVRQ